jgi:hypothetical protein
MIKRNPINKKNIYDSKKICEDLRHYLIILN